MKILEIYQYIEKIGCMSISTFDGSTLQSRIISIADADDTGIYFLTMTCKPFYRQLKQNPRISMCGIYPHGRKNSKNAVGQPYLVPGITFRLDGEAHEVPLEEVRAKAHGGSSVHQYTLEECERYPAMCLFCITQGQGEVYDYDFEMEYRDHKLLRTPFAFGGESILPLGAEIDRTLCIACGACFSACTFKAIVPGEPHSVDVRRCDMCGTCAGVCPQNAIRYLAGC